MTATARPSDHSFGNGMAGFAAMVANDMARPFFAAAHVARRGLRCVDLDQAAPRPSCGRRAGH
jgi:hypothetical protein